MPSKYIAENLHSVLVSPYGFEMECGVEVDPGEPPTWDHPGSAPTAILLSCKVGGIDISDMLTDQQTERIQQCCMVELETF